MATDSTAISNLSLSRMGQDLIDSITGTDSLSEKCNLLYTQALEELTVMGPLHGWKFAKRMYNCILDDETAVTVIADYSGTVAGTIKVTAVAHTLVTGDNVELDGDTGYDGTYRATVIDVDNFYVTATYASTGTGTARWTSNDYNYRYAMPTSLRIDSVKVGGLEVTDWVRQGVYLLTNMEDTSVDMTYVQSITDTTLFPPHFTRVLVLMLAIKLHYNLTQDLNAIQLLNVDYDLAMSKAIAMDEREKYVREHSSSWVDMGHTRETLEINGDNGILETGYGSFYN